MTGKTAGSPRRTSTERSRRYAIRSANSPRKKVKVVADTNILISAFIADGAPREFIRRCAQGKYLLVTSQGILNEYAYVMDKDKFKQVRPDLQTGLIILLNIAQVVETEIVPRIVPDDPDDDKIIATALNAKADFLVTGDQHLLRLKKFRGIPILPVTELLALDHRP